MASCPSCSPDDFTMTVAQGATLDRYVIARKNNRPEDISTVTNIDFVVLARDKASELLRKTLPLVVGELTCGEIHVVLTIVETAAFASGQYWWRVEATNADATVDIFPQPAARFVVTE